MCTRNAQPAPTDIDSICHIRERRHNAINCRIPRQCSMFPHRKNQQTNRKRTDTKPTIQFYKEQPSLFLPKNQQSSSQKPENFTMTPVDNNNHRSYYLNITHIPAPRNTYRPQTPDDTIQTWPSEKETVRWS